MRSRINRVFIYVYMLVTMCVFGCPCRGNAEDIGLEHAWLIVYDRADAVSEKIAGNIRAVASYASVRISDVDMSDAPRLDVEMMSHFPVVLLASENVVNHVYGPDILDYVRQGGILGVMMRGWAPDWMPELGIDIGDAPEYRIGSGFKTIGSVYQNISLCVDEKSFGSSYLKCKADENWKTRIEYLNPVGRPMFMTRSLGKGKVLFWNCSSLHEKFLRGVLLFSIMRELPVAAVSIFNAMLFQIDDSPPPAFGLKKNPVYREFDLTDAGFYLKIWYPDVLGLLRDYRIKPTHFFCMNYRGKIMEPFPELTDRQEFIDCTLDIIASWGNEIGFHGYNHQSLTTNRDVRNPWPSEMMMSKSLESARKIWQRNHLPPCMLYAPPNNILSFLGKHALRSGYADLRGVFRLYGVFRIYNEVDESDKSIDNQGDEFGPDPQVPELVNVPRFSSGMAISQAQKMKVVNGVMAHGMINHFIHPDDMIDLSRAVSKDWMSAIDGFRNLLIFFNKLLPCSERIYSSRFITRLKAYCSSCARSAVNSENIIRIESPGMGRKYWYVFSREAVQEWLMTGARKLCELEAGHLWIMELTEPVAKIQPVGP